MSDWIDDEAFRRRHGVNALLLQSQHEAVNARYPGCTMETCCDCGGRTGRAGRGDDSIYCDQCDEGPFCSECWKLHPHNYEGKK
jgi:hypothetical protein